MPPKERYDKEEDEANDIHHHDNPNHSSQHANEVAEQETKAQVKEAEVAIIQGESTC